ncbi:MAG: hypothetical protein ABI680_11905 [Chthoniobacteraceae bacterium]
MNLAIFFGASIGLASGIHRVQPFPKLPGIYQKYLHYAEHREDYDVLFVGTSRVYKGLIPHVFDAEVMRRTGQTVRAFNFGYDAMWPPEEFYVLRRLLELHPQKLRWVIMECIDIRTTLPAEAAHTERMAYWHDAEHTRLVCRAVAAEKWPWPSQWKHYSGHLSMWMQRWTNAGLGAQWLAYEFGLEKRKKSSRWAPPKVWADTDGYRSEPERVMSGQVLQEFRDAKKEWARGSRAKPAPRVLREELQRMVDEIRAAGAQPILLMAPTRSERRNMNGLPEGVPVFRFDDALAHPDLFADELHFDVEHMNHDGSLLLTQKLAEKFSALLEETKR